MVFTSTTPWKPKKFDFLFEKFEIQILTTFDEELKSP